MYQANPVRAVQQLARVIRSELGAIGTARLTTHLFQTAQVHSSAPILATCGRRPVTLHARLWANGAVDVCTNTEISKVSRHIANMAAGQGTEACASGVRCRGIWRRQKAICVIAG